MNAFIQIVERWLQKKGILEADTPVAVVSRPQVPLPSVDKRPGPRVVVKRAPIPYWQERGWKKECGNYQGNFQTPFGQWPGYVTESPSKRVEVFIHNPPAILRRHSHWQCFNKRDGGWYFVHPVVRIADVSAGILGVEKTIAEAYAS
jgi:hypothetical protein